MRISYIVIFISGVEGNRGSSVFMEWITRCYSASVETLVYQVLLIIFLLTNWLICISLDLTLFAVVHNQH